MAIWQYHIYMVPEEEITAYFKEDNSISYDDLNGVKWWKYRQIDLDLFDVFLDLLPKKDSWSNEIILFGDESSNCIEILLEEKKTVEVSIRLDLRLKNNNLVNLLCDFALINKCIFLNDKLEILYPSSKSINDSIASYPAYKIFLDKLKG